MRIVIFSLGPVFPLVVHGGSQKTLAAVLWYLGEVGHQCEVFCTQRADNCVPFSLHPNVIVHPVLEFKQTYPEPYYTAPYCLARIITILSRALDGADRFYIHDGELLFHFLYDSVPTTVGLQDFVYPDTLAGAMSFRRDHMLVPSAYLKAAVLAAFADFRPLDPARISVVPNGFDLQVLEPVESGLLRSHLQLTGDELPVLFPHRPDPRKGLIEAINIVDACRGYLPAPTISRIRLLVPVWMDSSIVVTTDHVYQGLYDSARKHAEALGLQHLLHFHAWLEPRQMPAYYSLGRATLCIGTFIESFGNVAVESQLCGTPAIVARVGALREVLPASILRKVNPGQVTEAAEALAGFLSCTVFSNTETRAYVAQHYSLMGMVEGYAAAILSTRLSEPAHECPPRQPSLDDRLLVPPWCDYSASGYYNDYHHSFTHDQVLLTTLKAYGLSLTVSNLVHAGIDPARIDGWVTAGHLLRVPGNSTC